MANEKIAISNQQSTIKNRAYDHARREPVRRVLRWMTTHIGWRFLARIDTARITGLENLPPAGPAILMINHIAFIDPVIVLGNLPRNIVPLAKAEVYRYPVWGIFPRLWDVIPVHREELDRRKPAIATGFCGKGGQRVAALPDGRPVGAFVEVRLEMGPVPASGPW